VGSRNRAAHRSVLAAFRVVTLYKASTEASAMSSSSGLDRPHRLCRRPFNAESFGDRTT
jgi:hypothetical protein